MNIFEKISFKKLEELDLRGNKIKRKNYSSNIAYLQYTIKQLYI